MSRLRGLRAPIPLVGAITLALAAGLSVFVFGGYVNQVFSEGGQTVRAVFADTNDMAEGSAVRVNGVNVGQVKEITVNPGGRNATVEMEVDEDVVPLYADATAAVSWRNLLGSTMVVLIDRGTPAEGELGDGVIPEGQTSSQVELDPIISVLRADAKDGLRTMMGELPRALRDREVLASALDTLADASPSLRRGLAAVRGERDGDLRRLVRNTAATVRALDRPEELRDLFEGGARTLETTARREADVRAAITRTAQVAPRVVETMSRLESTLSIADPVIARLRDPAEQVAPTAARLRPVLSEADSLLRDATPLLRALPPAATSLAAAARDGLPLLRELAPSLARVDDPILPDLARRSPVTGLSTYEMIGPFFASFSALAAHFDSRGRYVRFPVSNSERSLNFGPCRAFITDPEGGGFTEDDQTAPMLRCRELMDAISQYFSWSPLPGGTP